MEVTELKMRTDIVKEIGSRIPLRKKGAAFMGHCPWHTDSNPSLAVFPRTQTFKCFSCGQGKDVIDFISAFYDVDFREAMRILAGDITLETPKRVIQMPERIYVDAEAKFREYKVPSTKQVQEHAGFLGVKPGSLRWLDVRIDQNVLVFPMRDSEGAIIGLRFRAKNGRKWSLKDGRSGLFIPTKPFREPLLISEGPTDVAALLTAGLFGIGRASCLGQHELISTYIEKHSIKEIVIISDNDESGIRGAEKLQATIPNSRIVKPAAKDIRELLRNAGTEAVRELSQPTTEPKK